MKTLLAALLFSQGLSAATISQFRSAVEGSSMQKFEIKKDKVVREKRSNFFDTEKTYDLGVFTSQKTKEVERLEKDLNLMLTRLKKADLVLREKGSSFNELVKTGHRTQIIIEGYQLTSASELYKEAENLLARLKALNWQHENGVKLSSDKKEMSLIEKGKVQGKEVFELPFYCKKDTPPTYCHYKKFGILYIE